MFSPHIPCTSFGGPVRTDRQFAADPEARGSEARTANVAGGGALAELRRHRETAVSEERLLLEEGCQAVAQAFPDGADLRGCRGERG